MAARVSATGPIAAGELEWLMADLVPIGMDEVGATTRLAWSSEDARARGWFEARAADLGRRVERDPAGNLWALPAQAPPWWAAGSHLDTVLRGGRFDGALGVAAAFAIAARAPVAVIAFADEEGARFNTPTFGSRALCGRLDIDDALARTDAAGIVLADALRWAGVEPDGLAHTPAWLERLRGFLELHIDQTSELARAGAPVAVVSRLAARSRTEALLTGRADHAGTTFGAERHDALAAAARLIVRGEDLAAEDGEMVFTAARIEVEPNASSTVPSLARLWLDARAREPERLRLWTEQLHESAARIASERGVRIELRAAAFSPGTEFPQEVRRRLAGGEPVPEVLCWAGHDAGVLAERVPAGMLLVRNAGGVSHAPEEEVSLKDAALGAQAMLRALGEL